MNMDYCYMMPKDAKNVNGNPGDWHPILVLYATKNDIFLGWKWTSIPRVPIYIFDILRHHASMIYAHFLWRTHCPTKNGFKASVKGVQTTKLFARMATKVYSKQKSYTSGKCVQDKGLPHSLLLQEEGALRGNLQGFEDIFLNCQKGSFIIVSQLKIIANLRQNVKSWCRAWWCYFTYTQYGL